MAMPDKTLREVAEEWADRAVGQCDSIIDCKLVENAIIAGMRAALAEPSEGMMNTAIKAPLPMVMLDSITARRKSQQCRREGNKARLSGLRARI
jgi:uncharacterized protein YbcI